MSLSALIWSTADLLRGDYKQYENGAVILPFTLLRRLECVLEPTRKAVFEEYNKRKNSKVPLSNPSPKSKAKFLQHHILYLITTNG